MCVIVSRPPPGTSACRAQSPGDSKRTKKKNFYFNYYFLPGSCSRNGIVEVRPQSPGYVFARRIINFQMKINASCAVAIFLSVCRNKRNSSPDRVSFCYSDTSLYFTLTRFLVSSSRSPFQR